MIRSISRLVLAFLLLVAVPAVATARSPLAVPTRMLVASCAGACARLPVLAANLAADQDPENESAAGPSPVRAARAFLALVAALALAGGLAVVLTLALVVGTSATSLFVGFARKSALDGLTAFLAIGGTALGAALGVPGGVLCAVTLRSVLEHPFAWPTTLLLGAVLGPMFGAALGAAFGVGLATIRRARGATEK